MIPLSYRDGRLGALRALSQSRNPAPLARLVDRAQRWASLMEWRGRERVLELMEQTNALVTPDRAAESVQLADAGPV